MIKVEEFQIGDNYIYNSHLLGKCKIGNLIVGIDIPQIIVINLSTRCDRKIRVIKDMQKYGIPFSFFTAIEHQNAVRGCLESHISIIKSAKTIGYKAVCIFEDDVLIDDGNGLITISSFPQDWDMIYLGGLCTETQNIKLIEGSDDKWIKGRIYCNHAYIIRNTVYDKIVNEGWNYQGELDRFYTTEIHGNSNYNCYTTLVQRAKQYSDYSDIDKRNKWIGYKWPIPGDSFYIP